MHIEFNAKKTYGQNVRVDQRRSIEKNNILKSAHGDKKDKVKLSKDLPSAEAPVGVIDKIDLSKGMSIEDVNKLLVSEMGKKVKDMFEEAGVDTAAVADTDWSPEATAERIFRGTTGLFEIWKAQHKDMSYDELIDSFESVLRNSVNQGATEAIGLIEARGFEQEESVVATARETVSLVHSKFDDYFSSLRSDGSNVKESTHSLNHPPGGQIESSQ